MTREEAREILTHNWTRVDNPNYSESELDEAFFMAIEALQAKPKTGKWTVKQGNYCGVMLKEFYCDQCMTRGALRRVFSDPEPLPNFCGHCGADMRGGEAEQDETLGRYNEITR